jgi:hypothetical protein
MSAAMGSPLGERLRETPGQLRVEFGYSTASELAEMYRAMAVACIERQIARVLIVAGDEEPAGERALRDALTTMVLAGIADGFRLTIVARHRAAHTYRLTQRDFNAAGISTRLFDNEDDAVRWLEAGDGAAPAEDQSLSRSSFRITS